MKLIIGIFLFTLHLCAQAQTKPDLMLLSTYQQQNVTGWLVSEKLDGVRAYWDGKKLISRQGNIYHAPDWFIAGFPSFPLDGELWLGRGQFEQTVSIVRQHNPSADWQKISYQVFDAPSETGGLLSRLNRIQHYLSEHPVNHVRIVPHYTLDPMHSIHDTLQAIVSQGAEGLVIRDPNAPYTPGRSNTAYKVKPLYDAECTITGYTPGQGKYQNLVGALICINDQQQELRLGSGLTDELRQHPPQLGTRVSYQYSGYTATGHPRHATFWRVRTDQD